MNWTKLIEDLIVKGLSQQDIADRCNTSQGFISDLYRRRRVCPNWVIGDLLIKLHTDVVHKNIDAANFRRNRIRNTQSSVIHD